MKKKRKPQKKRVTGLLYNEPSEVFEFFSNNPDVLVGHLIAIIDDGIEDGEEEIDVYDLNDTGVIVKMPKADWNGVLDALIEHCTDIEDYESCAKARDLKSKLNK